MTNSTICKPGWKNRMSFSLSLSKAGSHLSGDNITTINIIPVVRAWPHLIQSYNYNDIPPALLVELPIERLCPLGNIGSKYICFELIRKVNHCDDLSVKSSVIYHKKGRLILTIGICPWKWPKLGKIHQRKVDRPTNVKRVSITYNITSDEFYLTIERTEQLNQWKISHL